ncbi:MAG TPA: dihydrofolate reductase [Bacteroidales bacterium]|nr:dihydrofolate reductase [Bacteroidales bacterium]HPT51844.1 dihydrofolate reductase [Bacteroidales bacterium]
MKNLNLIVVVGNNGEIGFQNQLLCHLPKDLKHFKEITNGHTIVMGRKTWESLKVKPLPNRRNIILSQNPDFKADGVELFSSPAALYQAISGDETVFIIGGQSIYQLFFHQVETLYITRILTDFKADAFFPPVNPEMWTLTEDVFVPKDEKNIFDMRFQKYCKSVL